MLAIQVFKSTQVQVDVSLGEEKILRTYCWSYR